MFLSLSLSVPFLSSFYSLSDVPFLLRSRFFFFGSSDCFCSYVPSLPCVSGRDSAFLFIPFSPMILFGITLCLIIRAWRDKRSQGCGGKRDGQRWTEMEGSGKTEDKAKERGEGNLLVR